VSASDQDRPGKVAVVAARLSLLWALAMIVGVYGSVLGWRPGAYLLLTAVTGFLVGHLVMGLGAYRSVMRRPWPVVPPLDDEDEW
jgi:hypothetical protein